MESYLSKVHSNQYHDEHEHYQETSSTIKLSTTNVGYKSILPLQIKSTSKENCCQKITTEEQKSSCCCSIEAYCNHNQNQHQQQKYQCFCNHCSVNYNQYNYQKEQNMMMMLMNQNGHIGGVNHNHSLDHLFYPLSLESTENRHLYFSETPIHDDNSNDNDQNGHSIPFITMMNHQQHSPTRQVDAVDTKVISLPDDNNDNNNKNNDNNSGNQPFMNQKFQETASGGDNDNDEVVIVELDDDDDDIDDDDDDIDASEEEESEEVIDDDDDDDDEDDDEYFDEMENRISDYLRKNF